MSELFNVNTFIVSQVNPYVVPFISVDGGGVLESRIRKKLSMIVKAFIGNELRHITSQLFTIGLLPLGVKRLLNFVTQEYKGHVTIIPQPKMIHYRNVLVNPDEKDYHDAINSSYNSTLQSNHPTLILFRNIFDPRSLWSGEGV
jgi:TAG lipase / steryl ester hydrolase / phospholipase A2 / LPA acyltransferase